MFSDGGITVGNSVDVGNFDRDRTKRLIPRSTPFPNNLNRVEITFDKDYKKLVNIKLAPQVPSEFE